MAGALGQLPIKFNLIVSDSSEDPHRRQRNFFQLFLSDLGGLYLVLYRGKRGGTGIEEEEKEKMKEKESIKRLRGAEYWQAKCQRPIFLRLWEGGLKIPNICRTEQERSSNDEQVLILLFSIFPSQKILQ